jgi:hypothetical protein
MLEDRDYMRQPPAGPRPLRAVLLAILNAIAVRVRQIVRWPWARRDSPLFRPAPRKLVNVRPAKSDKDLSTDKFLQMEVDPILDKISAHGIQSLTVHEREILEKARYKMVKR